MAPLDPDAAGRSNTLPLAVLSGQVALVASLTAHILRTIYRSSRALPPAADTRAQQSTRNRNVGIFSVLALLSLVSASTFAVAWRLASYFEWAGRENHEAPGGIWSGDYGTGQGGVGHWRLGDWWADVDLIDSSTAKVFASPEAFLYLYQHFSGITAAAIFFGVEGRRRNLPVSTIASFVALSAIGSLGFAINLFFVTMLFTPMAVHDDDSHRHDALFAPKPSVFYVPVVGAFALEQCLPYLLARRVDLTLFRIAYLTVPLFLAFIPEFSPARWGHRYQTKADAHRSYTRVFYVLGLTALFMTWKQFGIMFLVNTPPEPNPFVGAYDTIRNAISKNHLQKPNRFMQGLGNTADTLKSVSKHPAISVTAMDCAFTALSLLAWTFLRQLDVGDILENSALSFLAPSEEKDIAIKEELDDEDEETLPQTEEYVRVEEPVEETKTPRKRGRPRKNATPEDIASTTSSSVPSTTIALPKLGNHTVTKEVPVDTTNGLRRSTRRRTANGVAESEADSAYEPEREVSEALEQIEFDGSPAPEDLVAGGESTALALVISFFGGLGQLAASVLGAEVTGGA